MNWNEIKTQNEMERQQRNERMWREHAIELWTEKGKEHFAIQKMLSDKMYLLAVRVATTATTSTTGKQVVVAVAVGWNSKHQFIRFEFLIVQHRTPYIHTYIIRLVDFVRNVRTTYGKEN